MKSNKGIVHTITLIIIGLVIAGTAGAATVQQASVNNAISFIKAQPLRMVKQDSPLPLTATPITPGVYNSHHPGLAASPSGIFYASAEVSHDGSMWQPGVFSSDSSGSTWTEDIEFTYPGAEYTALDANSIGTYGTFGAPPDQSSLLVFYQAEDPEGNGGVWDWGSQGFTNLYNNDIAAYDDPNPNATDFGWIISLVGDFDGDVGVPMVFYPEFGPNYYGLMNQATGLTGYLHAANNNDQSKLLNYNVYDKATGTGLFVWVINLGVWLYNSEQQYWYHPDKKTVQIDDEAQFQVQYPSITAQNNTVLIVAQKINGSTNDIILYRSTNGLTSYTRMTLAESSDDELYPQVAFVDQGKAVCTYCKNGVLYFKQTEDGGATWSAESQVSDSQVNAQYRTEALCTKLGAGFAAWEDTRDGVIDIYFNQIASPHVPPTLEIGEITASIGHVSVVIKCVGYESATTVDWNITLLGGHILLGKLSTGSEVNVPAGEPVTVKSRFIFGFGKPFIMVRAICAEGDSATRIVQGSVFFFFVRIV